MKKIKTTETIIDTEVWKNKLYFSDCLDILKKMPEEFIDLIYIDPPFNSNRKYNILYEDADVKDVKAQKEAFADTWSNITYKDTLQELKDIDLQLVSYLETLDKLRISRGAVSYLTTMAIRIWYMHKVLKPTGSFYLHCDPTICHYLKIICDLIFGEKNFLNDIIWSYHRWTNNVGAFISTHDNILFYCKNYDKHKFNQQTESFSEKSKHQASRVSIAQHGKVVSQSYTGDTSRLKAMRDVWEISYLNSQAAERLGYPTQKPEELLKRVIKASSNEGDLVTDFFCGCGTTIAAAQELKRRWIGVDISHLAIGLVERKRLIEPYANKLKGTYEIDGFPKDIASAKQLSEKTEGGRFKFQDWIIEAMLGGIHNPKKTADGGWDGHLTFEITIGEKKKKEIILVEVKSGNVNVKNLREFIHVVNKEGAAMGVFVCFIEQITKPMLSEAKDEGYYNGFINDKIQIITVEDLLDGKNIDMPISKKGTFKSAKRKNIDKGGKQSSAF